MKTLPNIHPGEVLLSEFLEPLGISQNALARAAVVPPRRINEIVLGKRSITADFRTEEGQALVHRLAAHADVVIENFKVGGLVKYGLDAVSMRPSEARLSAPWPVCSAASDSELRKERASPVM